MAKLNDHTLFWQQGNKPPFKDMLHHDYLQSTQFAAMWTKTISNFMGYPIWFIRAEIFRPYFPAKLKKGMGGGEWEAAKETFKS